MTSIINLKAKHGASVYSQILHFTMSHTLVTTGFGIHIKYLDTEKATTY